MEVFMKRFLFLFALVAAGTETFGDSCDKIESPPKQETGCCGLDVADDDLKISGEAAINQFPWLALIENKDERITCTGVLISSQHVLTAAQCNYHGPVKVRLGEYNKTHSGPDCVVVDGKKVCNDGAITIPIATVRSHPEFQRPNHKGHDIALIKLADKVPFNEFIRPICLPSSDVLISPPSNLRLVNAGWGSRPSSSYEDDVVKHYVQLPYVDNKTCQKVHSSLKDTSYQIRDSHICAGGEKGLDSCRGDGGGPLMYKDGGLYTLVGIVSFGRVPCGVEGVPSVYTKVYSHIPWIESLIKSL